MGPELMDRMQASRPRRFGADCRIRDGPVQADLSKRPFHVVTTNDDPSGDHLEGTSPRNTTADAVDRRHRGLGAMALTTSPTETAVPGSTACVDLRPRATGRSIRTRAGRSRWSAAAIRPSRRRPSSPATRQPGHADPSAGHAAGVEDHAEDGLIAEPEARIRLEFPGLRSNTAGNWSRTRVLQGRDPGSSRRSRTARTRELDDRRPLPGDRARPPTPRCFEGQLAMTPSRDTS